MTTYIPAATLKQLLRVQHAAMATMRPARIATSATRAGAPVPSMTWPP